VFNVIKIEKKEKCSGCSACMASCPVHCIEMKEDEEGFYYPVANEKTCKNCGRCERVCPIFMKSHAEQEIKGAYAIVSKDTEERLMSSSGGVFSLLAKEVLSEGGVVFGAAMANDWKSVNHVVIKKDIDLNLLRGSKYVQSKIGDAYLQAQKYLDKGRKVLFTGTPCQIGGLRQFLNRDYKNLYLQDIICHGVPSTYAWEEYVNFREKKVASTTKKVLFRHKKYGWKTYSVLFKYSNGTEYDRVHGEDLYIKIFLDNYDLRPSCYNCAFKHLERHSDITLADLWGAQDMTPELDDNKGVSLAIVHSEKGERLLANISDKIITQEVPLHQAISHNTSMIESEVRPPERDDFYNDLKELGFQGIEKKYYPMTVKQKVIRWLRGTKRELLYRSKNKLWERK